jgi:putative flippase GtrA
MRAASPLASQTTRATLLRFLFVGGVSSLSYAALFALVIDHTDVPVFASGIVLFGLFVPATFQVHKRFTFLSARLRKHSFYGYAALQMACFSLVSAVSAHLVTEVYFLDLALYLATVGFTALLTFLVGKFVIFRPVSEAGQRNEASARKRR